MSKLKFTLSNDQPLLKLESFHGPSWNTGLLSSMNIEIKIFYIDNEMKMMVELNELKLMNVSYFQRELHFVSCHQE